MKGVGKNPRMSTKYKPVQAKDIPRRVRNAIDAYIRGREIPFKGVIVMETTPSLFNPHVTKVTFYGNTRFQQGYALYEGPYGIWEVDLVGLTGPISEKDWQIKPCAATYGTPRCLKPSDEWKETSEQERERLRNLIRENKI